MKKLIPVLLILFVACTQARLDRYPGKSLSEFPESLRGEYRIHASGLNGLFAGKKLDSLRIRITAIAIESLSENGWESEFKISESNVLSNYNNLYFISRKDPKLSNYWNGSFLWVNGKDLNFAEISYTDVKVAKDKLKNYLPLMYIVNKPKTLLAQEVNKADKLQLKKLRDLNIENADTVYYYKMDEAALERFFMKELNARQTLRFVKVTPTEAKK